MQWKKNKQTGFTIVELLIVVVVIAILAAITIVSYNGITRRADASDLAGSLRTAATKLEAYKVANGDVYPTDLATAGVAEKSNVSTTYQTDGAATYCLAYARGESQYFIKSSDKTVQSGGCPQQKVELVAGSKDSTGYVDAVGAAARFGLWSYGMAVSMNTGNVYVANMVDETGDRPLRKITPNGTVTTLANLKQPGATSAVGVDSQENVYFYWNTNQSIVKVTPQGVMSTLATGLSVGTMTSAIAIDNDGNVYVPEASNNRIRKITKSGVVSTFAGSGVSGSADGTGTAAQFNLPTNVILSPVDGNLYVIDSRGVRQITLGGVVTTKLAFASSQAATCRPSPIQTCAIAEAFFLSPVGLAIDKNGYFYLGDTWGAIVRVSPSGVVEALAGLSDSGSPASSSPISGYTYPWAVGVNSSGELYFMIRGGLFKLR